MHKETIIVGISCYYNDSVFAIIKHLVLNALSILNTIIRNVEHIGRGICFSPIHLNFILKSSIV